VTFDARGSGDSDYVGPYTHAQWVADVDAIRASLGAETFVMGGGSYGGFLTLEYALAHPDRVEALILRDTAARSYDAEAKHNALARAEEFPWLTPEVVERALGGEFRDNDEFREMFAAIQPLYDVNYDPVAGAARLDQIKFNYVADNFAFSHNLPNYDIRDQLQQITVPVLITVGRHDWITPVQASEELHALLPNSELVIFENSGHSPQIEEYDAWIKTVEEFLRRYELI
jgi:proline iminopeptidase